MSALYSAHTRDSLRDSDIDIELAEGLVAKDDLPHLAKVARAKGGQHGHGEVVGPARLHRGRQVVAVRAGVQVDIVQGADEDDVVFMRVPGLPCRCSGSPRWCRTACQCG